MLVIAVHISGHFGAVNSVALKQIGYTAATKDPVGGVIRRRPGSREDATRERGVERATGIEPV